MANFLQPVRGEQYLIEIGSVTGNTITWQASTVFNASKSVSFSTSTQEDNIPDLEDLSRPYAVIKTIDTIDYTLTGSGMIDKREQKTFIDWLRSGQPKWLRYYSNTGSEGWTISGQYILTQYEITADTHKVSTAQVTMSPFEAPSYANTGVVANTTTIV